MEKSGCRRRFDSGSEDAGSGCSVDSMTGSSSEMSRSKSEVCRGDGRVARRVRR